MRDSITSSNMFDVLHRHIEGEFKHTLTEEIVKSAVDDYEKQVREKLEPIIKRITIDRIESYREGLGASDEFKVYVQMHPQINVETVGTP